MFMIALFDDPTPVTASARRRSAKVKLPMPRAPTCRKLRRETPSQYGFELLDQMGNIAISKLELGLAEFSSKRRSMFYIESALHINLS